MNDYINREAVIEMLWDLVELENAYEMKKQAVEIVQNWEPSDVRENVHAKKVIGGGERDGSTCWFECSHCHGTVDLQDMFCKHCGAVLEYEK